MFLHLPIYGWARCLRLVMVPGLLFRFQDGRLLTRACFAEAIMLALTNAGIDLHSIVSDRYINSSART